jgi:tripartite-type tricarboxylate transporter receptor subunit TctC
MHHSANLFGITLTAFIGLATASQASDEVESFYRGKTVTLFIGYSAGGGYDLYARLLARHLGNHIPGRPNVVPQNMPGAGSLKAAAYLAKVAVKDGTAIGTFSRGMPIYPILFTPEFDGTKLGYLGSITTDTSLCITWKSSPIKTWADVISKPSSFGGEGKGSDPDVFATLIADVFKAKVKLVTGYPGTADITLAMERGELDGLCGISYSTLKSAHKDWLDKKQINIVVQAAVRKDPALPAVPSMLDEAVSKHQRQVVDFAVAPQAMARPFAAPPGVPEDRLSALKKAFDATMKDPAFLEDAAGMGLDVNPVSGQELQSLVQHLYSTPKDVIADAARAMGAQPVGPAQ